MKVFFYFFQHSKMNEILRVGRVLVKEGELSLEVKGSVVVTRSYSGTQDGGDRHLALRQILFFSRNLDPLPILNIAEEESSILYPLL